MQLIQHPASITNIQSVESEFNFNVGKLKLPAVGEVEIGTCVTLTAE